MKLHEILELDYELNGIIGKEGDEQKEIFTGILRKDISFPTKHYLLRLSKWVGTEKSLFEETRKELFSKYGTEKEGQIEISKENMEDFQREYNDVLAVEKTISIKEICGADLTLDMLKDVRGKEVYFQLSNLVEA